MVTNLVGRVTADGLNVRTGPNTSSSIITVIYQGATVNVLKQSSGWYYIQTGSTKGWVYAQYLSC